ncbi:MAG TPA: hypothetical protein DCM62_08795 [Bacteroidales bacterium]|nr:hypothetical protein [Bacteroidales bacterium]
MKCPVCVTVDLVMTERSQIEIDYCPNCRGIWLDRGELDKILDRATATQGPSRQDTRPYDPRYPDPRYGHKPGKHWLKELFD